MKKVLLWPNSVLKLVSAPVLVEETNSDAESLLAVKNLAQDMANVMGAYGGVGLAAVQINVPVRVVTSFVHGAARVYVNPRIVKNDGESELVREGCLSLPGIVERVRRFPSTVLEFQPLLGDRIGPVETFTAHGLLAQVLQHELDHLDGRLFVDSLSAGVRQNIRGDLRKRWMAGQLKEFR